MQKNPINVFLAAAVVALSILAFTRSAGAGTSNSGEVACACTNTKCCCAQVSPTLGPGMACQ